MKYSGLFFSLLILISCSDDDVSPPNASEEDSVLEMVAQTPNTWQYVEDAEMRSRNGETTGFLASINPQSSRLIVYFEGGGACFNAITCDGNEEEFGTTDGNEYAANLNTNSVAHLFNRNATNNPYRDWNYIFVPYSTGDVHSGVNNDADVPNGGPQNQQMNGYSNFSEVVKELQDYFDVNALSDIIVTGSSAGGYGTYLNFIQVAEAFPNSQLTGLVDAGPMFFNDTVFDSCLANLWDDLFMFNYPSDYNSVVTTNYPSDIQGIYEYLSKKYPTANFGLISDTEDLVIRSFFGFGINGCNGSPNIVSATDFYNGLLGIEAELNAFTNWSVYYAPGDSHTFLGGNRVLNTTVNGVILADWIEQLRAGTASDVLP